MMPLNANWQKNMQLILDDKTMRRILLENRFDTLKQLFRNAAQLLRVLTQCK